jgi:molybdopterin molybdotransferase
MSRGLLPIDDARAIVTRIAGRRLGTETVRIDDALGRVLAADVVADDDVPRFSSSAMDGYAVVDPGAGAELAVVGESRAGHPYRGALGPGQAVRISTGAQVPDDARAVIRQEDVHVQAHDTTIQTQVELTPGENLRLPGEDMRGGEVVLTSGMRLRAPELGAGVAAGAGELTVARRPVVSVLATGDELRAPGEPLGPGQIHNSNALVLRALVTRCGGEPDRGQTDVLPDDPRATEQALGEVLGRSDVVIVSGGVSVGPHDHVKPALASLGVTEHFWGVALQPGKPTWFGARQDTLVFGLPGNPVSAAVTFSLFARPALDVLLGAIPERPPLPEAELAQDVARNPVRAQAIRVRLEMRGGRPVVSPTGAQGSHLFTSLLRAECLAMIPQGEGRLAAGTTVKLEPLPA